MTLIGLSKQIARLRQQVEFMSAYNVAQLSHEESIESAAQLQILRSALWKAEQEYARTMIHYTSSALEEMAMEMTPKGSET